MVVAPMEHPFVVTRQRDKEPVDREKELETVPSQGYSRRKCNAVPQQQWSATESAIGLGTFTIVLVYFRWVPQAVVFLGYI